MTLLVHWRKCKSILPSRNDLGNNNKRHHARRNQTNLALKSIIGLEAMSQIAYSTDHLLDGLYFSQIASSYLDQWQTLGINYDADPPHAKLSYNEPDSYGKLIQNH